MVVYSILSNYNLTLHPHGSVWPIDDASISSSWHSLASPTACNGTFHDFSWYRVVEETQPETSIWAKIQTSWWLNNPSEKWWSSSDWIIIPAIGEVIIHSCSSHHQIKIKWFRHQVQPKMYWRCRSSSVQAFLNLNLFGRSEYRKIST